MAVASAPWPWPVLHDCNQCSTVITCAPRPWPVLHGRDQCSMAVTSAKWPWPVLNGRDQCPVAMTCAQWPWAVPSGHDLCSMAVTSAPWSWPALPWLPAELSTYKMHYFLQRTTKGWTATSIQNHGGQLLATNKLSSLHVNTMLKTTFILLSFFSFFSFFFGGGGEGCLLDNFLFCFCLQQIPQKWQND